MAKTQLASVVLDTQLNCLNSNLFNLRNLWMVKRKPERKPEGFGLPFWLGEGNDLGGALAVVVSLRAGSVDPDAYFLTSAISTRS